MKTVKQFKEHLNEYNLNACYPARKWAYNMTAKEAWDSCHRGDWLLWWAKKEGVNM